MTELALSPAQLLEVRRIVEEAVERRYVVRNGAPLLDADALDFRPARMRLDLRVDGVECTLEGPMPAVQHLAVKLVEGRE